MKSTKWRKNSEWSELHTTRNVPSYRGCKWLLYTLLISIVLIVSRTLINHDAWTLDAERLIAKEYQDEQVHSMVLLRMTQLIWRVNRLIWKLCGIKASRSTVPGPLWASLVHLIYECERAFPTITEVRLTTKKSADMNIALLSVWFVMSKNRIFAS